MKNDSNPIIRSQEVTIDMGFYVWRDHHGH